MARTQISSHPFALLIDPQAVLLAVEQSQRLEGLQRRICRPLDKPLLPMMGGAQGPDLEDDDELGAGDVSLGSELSADLDQQNL